MNCVNHPESPATAFCRSCGKALCPACERPALGSIYCAEHVPVTDLPGTGAPRTAPPPPPGANPSAYPPGDGASAYSPYNAPPAAAPLETGASPGLAFLLGLIPGVGAIYNGQYVKGLIHVIILGVLISIINSGSAGGMEPLFGLMIGVFVFYMAFEAYHTARKRQLGVAVDEFSSVFPLRPANRSTFPAGPIVLIAVGVLFLLNTLDLIRFSQLLRYWPVALIALGAYMLYERTAPEGGRGNRGAAVFPEGTHERQI